MEVLSFKISKRFSNQRLDRYLASRFAFRSRSWWKRAIAQGFVTLLQEPFEDCSSAKPCKPSRIVAGGELMVIDPRLFSGNRWLYNHKDLQFIHVDDALAVVEKPAGLLVHPLNALTKSSLSHLLGLSLGASVHLVHRLDRLTSGTIVVARSKSASIALDEQFRLGRVKKSYLALVEGVIPWDRREVKLDMGPDEASSIRIKMAVVDEGRGKCSHSQFTVRERFKEHTLVEARLFTGRTHQIRLHLSHLGFPILRDKLYGSKPELDYYEKGIANLTPYYPDWHALHAWRISFRHPGDGSLLSCESPPRSHFAELLKELRAEDS